LAQSVVTGIHSREPGQTRLRDKGRRERQINDRQNLPQDQVFAALAFAQKGGQTQPLTLPSVKMCPMRGIREHPKMAGRGMLIVIALVLSGDTGTNASRGAEPIYRSLPATKRPSPRDVVSVPEYRGGDAIRLEIGGRFAYLIKPRGKVDSLRRWVWIFPFEHGLAAPGDGVEHEFYIDALLAKGFHVAGIDIGVACGSPRGAERCQQFYSLLVGKYRLNPRVRLLAQSNGGLNAYAWAVRHPDCVDRLAGIYPATDLRSWPGLANAVAYPSQGLGFDLTQEQLAGRLAEYNPIESLQSLAKAHVKLLHLHGDQDKVVSLNANSSELARRYRALGGSVAIIVSRGYGHSHRPFSTSQALAAFLLAD
jgi:pimeloyl-ACP methyl ester carboxylesterase